MTSNDLDPAAEPEAEVTWSKDGKKLKKKKKDDRFSMKYDTASAQHVLEIKDATAEDHGKYDVTATNANGSVTHTINVNVTAEGVKETLTFSKLPEPVNVKEGEEIRLTCQLTGTNTLHL